MCVPDCQQHVFHTHFLGFHHVLASSTLTSQQAKNEINELTAVERPRIVMQATAPRTLALNVGWQSAEATPCNAANVLSAGGSGPVGGDGGAPTTMVHNLPQLQEEGGAKSRNEKAAPSASESDAPDDVQKDKGTVPFTNSLAQIHHEQRKQTDEEEMRSAAREADAVERVAADATVEADVDEAAGVCDTACVRVCG